VGGTQKRAGDERKQWSGDPEEVRKWLRERLLDALGLNEIRIGNHRQHAQDDTEGASLRVDAVWFAYVAPAFDPAASFVVVEEPGRRRFAFALTQQRESPIGLVWSIATESGPLPDTWQDPMTAALQHAPLYERPAAGIILDGISYGIEIQTGAMRSKLRFGNPRTAGAALVEKALLDALRSLAEVAGSALIADYVEVWAVGTAKRHEAET
jgi:hypothetical protein